MLLVMHIQGEDYSKNVIYEQMRKKKDKSYCKKLAVMRIIWHYIVIKHFKHLIDYIFLGFQLDLPFGTSMRFGRPFFKNAGKVRAVAPVPENVKFKPCS